MSESASGTLTVVELTPTSFQYNITITDTGPTAIGSFWLAWLPAEDFLPHPSTAQSGPSGWTATLENGGPSGSSIQFVASSPSSYLQSGGTLGGFTFTSPDSPAVLEGDSAQFPGTPILTSVAFQAGILVDAGGTFDIACFSAGTRILTAHGEIPVERLAVGDLVPTLRGDRLLPVRWLGHRSIDCRRHPHPERVWPVRVRAGAFGAHRPARDLLLSPDHAVYVDAVLIPIRYLVNGAMITQQPIDHVEYWHVELPAHEVLLAEGLACESYLDTGNRCAFVNGGPALLAYPNFSLKIPLMHGDAPLLVERPLRAAANAR